MTIHQDRVAEAIRTIASEEIIRFLEFSPHDFWVVSVTDIIVSRDGEYADLVVSCTENLEYLPKFLKELALPIHLRVSRDLGMRRTPKIRFRKMKNQKKPEDILSIINELDRQYGLSTETH